MPFFKNPDLSDDELTHIKGYRSHMLDTKLPAERASSGEIR
jgi:hypothetical protein